jgi:chemotaxis signal transduction protein
MGNRPASRGGLVNLPDGKSKHMGLVVDTVERVVNITGAEIEQTPISAQTLPSIT